MAAILLVTSSTTAQEGVLVGGIETPDGLTGQAQSSAVTMYVNDNTTSQLVLTLTIEKDGQTIASDTFVVTAATEPSYRFQLDWTPSLPGRYTFVIAYEYILDGDTYRSSATADITIHDLVVPQVDAYTMSWNPISYDAVPDNGAFQLSDAAFTIGTHSWRAYDIVAGDERYGNEMDVALVSPPLDLSMLSSAQLNFNERVQLEIGDVGAVQLSTVIYPGQNPEVDNNWKTLYTTSAMDNDQWQERIVDLTPWVDQMVQLQFRFRSNDRGTDQGWWVDEFQVLGDYYRHDIQVELLDLPDTVAPGTSQFLNVKLSNQGLIDQQLGNISLEASILRDEHYLVYFEPISLALASGESREMNLELDIPDEPGLYTLHINARLLADEKKLDNEILWPLVVGRSLTPLSLTTPAEPRMRFNTDEYEVAQIIQLTQPRNFNGQLAVVWQQMTIQDPVAFIESEGLLYPLSISSYEINHLERSLPSYNFELLLPESKTRMDAFELTILWETTTQVIQPQMVEIGLSGPQVILPRQDLELEPGQTGLLELEVFNHGLADDELYLFVEGLEDDWSYHLSRSWVLAEPRTSYPVTLTLTAPTDERYVLTTSELTVILNSKSNFLRHEQSLTITIPGPELSVTSWRSDRDAMLIGQQVYIFGVLHNSRSLATNLTLELTVSDSNGTRILETVRVDRLAGQKSHPLSFMYEPTTSGQVTFQLMVRSSSYPLELKSSSFMVQVVEDPSAGQVLSARPETPAYQEALLVTGISLMSLLAVFGTGLKYEGSRYMFYKALLPLTTPLYSRIKHEQMLDNDTRDDLVQFIYNNPGSNYSTIMRELSLSNGMFAYHLAILEREQYIVSRQEGIYRRFYPMDRVPGSDQGLLASRVDSKMKLTIVKVVASNPGISQSEVAKQMDQSRQRINYHVNKLVEDRVLSFKREGRATRLYLNPIFDKLIENS